MWWWEGWWRVRGLTGWRMCWGRRPGQQTARGSDTNSPGQHSSWCPSDLLINIFNSIYLPIICPQQAIRCYSNTHTVSYTYKSEEAFHNWKRLTHEMSQIFHHKRWINAEDSSRNYSSILSSYNGKIFANLYMLLIYMY